MANDRELWDWEGVWKSPDGQIADLRGKCDAVPRSTVLSIKHSLLDELAKTGSRYSTWVCVEFRAEKRPS